MEQPLPYSLVFKKEIKTTKHMTLAKIHRPASFNHMVDHFFGNSFPEFFTRDMSQSATPAVNVKENETEFVIEAALPGFSKDQFNLSVENQVLNLTAKKEQNQTEKTEKYMRKEFGFTQFERSFRLPETVNTEQIYAQYENGVLNIHLPKKEEAKAKGLRTIEVA